MLRSGKWDAQAVMTGMAKQVLRSLPPPADGKRYLIGDTTHKPKRGRQHPLGLVTRQSESSPYTFGFRMGVLVACWGQCRIPIAMATIDPKRKGHQNILFPQMLREFEPPSWVREVVVLADAGYPAHPPLKLIKALGWTYVFAMPRTRKFTHGKYVRDLVQHLPKSQSRRRATYKPDGRRRDYWVFMRPAELHQLGDVTLVLSKKRRNCGPRRVKLIVTKLLDGSASTILHQ
jgi:Transposase DDE domain